MVDLGTVIASTIIAAVGFTIGSRMEDRHDVNKCVEAYYSDKYSRYSVGRPTATFMTCMEKNFPQTFRRGEERYRPQNVTAPVTQ